MFKRLLLLIATIFHLNSFADCNIDTFVKSAEGQEKLSSLVDRSKGVSLSKLEELGIAENKVEFETKYPKSTEDLKSSMLVKLKSADLAVEGSSFTISKVIREEDCGIEISITGGRVLNKESRKDLGGLGLVKEFIRL